MPEQIIVCPYCKREIPLTEAITHEIKENLRGKFEAEFKKKEEVLTTREKVLAEKAKQITQSEEIIRKEVARKVKLEQERLVNEARQKAAEENSIKLKALQEEIDSKSKKLDESQKIELDLRRQKTKLEEREKSLELEVTRKIDAERSIIQQETLKRASEEHMFKDREKEKLIDDMKKQIDELKRKVEQTSQQAQGEVLELELEDMLKLTFPQDVIEPVSKGIKGADVLQKVNNSMGQYCGTIIWESKRTKNWSDRWIDKLKEDQRDIKADIAVLMTMVLPKDISNFAYFQGVWVSNYASAIGAATALRMTLIQVSNSKLAAVGKKDKMELLYNYLSGSEFRQKIEAIVEAFVSLKSDLDSEKRAMEKIWAQREKQIERVINSTARMYGDMQGIIGASLPAIKSLELKTLISNGEKVSN